MAFEITLVIGILFALLLFGAPIAVALIVSGTIGLWLLDYPMIVTIQRMAAGTESFVLMAIPLFIIAGAIMEAGGLSKRLVGLAEAMFGFLPGGLASANVGASMIFGGISGSAVADTSAVGSVMIPAMQRKGYSAIYSAAITASTSPIGMIIPPSIPMIVWSFISGQSLNELFLAGIVPGVLITIVMIIISTVICMRRGFEPGFQGFHLKSFLIACWNGILAIGAPAVIIGGIVLGLFTPTEASAVAVAYALIVTMVCYRELTLPVLWDVLFTSGKMSASIMFVVCGATVFSYFLTVSGVPDLVGQMFESFAFGPGMFVLSAGLLLFILGMFLDTTTTILITVPILYPLFAPVGVDPLVATNIFLIVLACGLITPPVGLCLFVVATIVPVKVIDVARECLPFIAGMLFVAALIWFFPPLVTWVR